MKCSMLLNCFFSVFFLSASTTVFPQQNDPIHWGSPIHLIQGENIFMLWSKQDNGGSGYVSRQKIYKFLNDSAVAPNQQLLGTQVHQSSPAGVSGNRQMDVATGYLTNGAFENVIAAWEGPNQTIQLMIPRFDSSSSTWSESAELTVPGPVVQYGAQQRGRIYVRTGDFLGIGKEQFALAFQGADSTIHLQVYDVDNSLTPHLIASINDEKLMPTPTDLARFSITTGDLNSDGKDEIVLDGIEQNYNGSGKWALYAKVYDVSGSSVIPEARRTIFVQPADYSIQSPEFGLTAGQFKKNGEDQVGLVCAANEQGGNNAYVFIYMLEASPDLSNLTYDITKRDSVQIGTGGSINDFSIASGDLNGSGRDELVFALNQVIYVYSTDDLLNLTYRLSMDALSNGNNDKQLSYDFLKVGDLNADGRDEVIVAKDIYGNTINHWLKMNAYTVLRDLSSDSLVATVSFDTTADSGPGSYYNYAMALGNFDSTSLTIGRPVHTVESNIVQPLVVLNTPPIHFDILNGNKYDLNNSFNGNAPDFYSTYEQQSSQSVNLETSTHNDVSDAAGVNLSGNVGASVQVAAEPLGVGASVSASIATNFLIKVEGTWGHSYSSEKSTTHTTSLDIGVSAKGDDQIYATTSSYDIWTYPVYIGNDTASVVNYINFASPVKTVGAWFPSKTYASNFYIPNHEVGNILSYLPSDSAMNNPDIDSSIVSIDQSQGLPISGQSGSHWDLNDTYYKNSHLDSTWHSGWDINYNYGAPAFSSVGNNAHFTSTTTSITSGFLLRAYFGAIVDSLGNIAAYTVFPYAYRSKGGAIVINYAVDPVVAGQGQSQSWWQLEYGSYSDPTFILPWFYDPEKGISLTENAKRYQTTDIFFNNYAPQPGDTIKITARVRNFSLATTPIPVTVKFYVGDPDSGGTVITGTNGADSVTTVSYIRDRGWSDANINWIVPSGLPQYPRIYAVADPDNKIQEVHENNNKGFNVLGRQSTVSGINTVNTVPGKYTLYQSFPNPFNPAATIRYSIPMGNHVIIKIYDILGRELATLVDRYERAGTYNVKFNGENYASGVYFYRINAGSFIQTKKMLLLK
jgi:hypothetical protein